MARRKKTNIGRRHKYYEKRIQDCRKNKPRSVLQLTGKSFNCLKLSQTIHFFLVKSFVEESKYLLEQQGVHYLLSERFSQDPLEDFFGKQRAHGGRCENPTVRQFITNTVSLRIQKSAALDPIRGNCRRKRQTNILVDDAPIPKCRKKSTG